MTDGIWDLQVQLRNEAKRKNIALGMIFYEFRMIWAKLIDWYFQQYFDIKHEFKHFLPYFSEFYQPGLKAMLEGMITHQFFIYNANISAFGMQFEGRHHSGLEDAKNIARLVLNLLMLGK